MTDILKETCRTFRTFRHMQTAVATIHAAQKAGIFRILKHRQHTADEMAGQANLDRETIENFCRVLTAIGILEKYGDDFALSNAAILQMEGDPTFNDYLFRDVERYALNAPYQIDLPDFRNRLAGRQWCHSAAARQAARVIESNASGSPKLMLELGCLAGVWSAAMGFLDPQLHITSVDSAEMLAAARTTFESVDLEERHTEIEADYRTFEPELGAYDLALFAEGLQLEDDANAVVLLGRCADALRIGGEVVIIEQLMETGEGQELAVATQALEVAMSTRGRIRSAAQIQQLLTGAGFQSARWATLTADDQGLGIMIAQRNDDLT